MYICKNYAVKIYKYIRVCVLTWISFWFFLLNEIVLNTFYEAELPLKIFYMCLSVLLRMYYCVYTILIYLTTLSCFITRRERKRTATTTATVRKKFFRYSVKYYTNRRQLAHDKTKIYSLYISVEYYSSSNQIFKPFCQHFA